MILQLFSHPSNLSAALAIRNLHTSGAWDRVFCAYNGSDSQQRRLSAASSSPGRFTRICRLVSCQTCPLSECDSPAQEVTCTQDSQNEHPILGNTRDIYSPISQSPSITAVIRMHSWRWHFEAELSLPWAEQEAGQKAGVNCNSYLSSFLPIGQFPGARQLHKSGYSEINAGVLTPFMPDLRRSAKSPSARLDETLKDIFGLNLPSIAIYLFLL